MIPVRTAMNTKTKRNISGVLTKLIVLIVLIKAGAYLLVIGLGIFVLWIFFRSVMRGSGST